MLTRIPRYVCSVLTLFFSLTIALFITVQAAQAAPLADAPWNPNVKVNDDSAADADQGWPVLVASKKNDEDVFAAWEDRRNGDTDIYFAYSDDGGKTWGTGVRVNHDTDGYDQWSPDLALDGNGVLHIVWYDLRTADGDIYYSRSTDNGLTWSSEIRINDVPTSTQNSPAIAAFDNTVCVVWVDRRFNSNGDIYADCSTDGGLTWGTDTRVNDDGAVAAFTHETPDIALSSARRHVVWCDNRNGNWDIYYAYFGRGGWSANVRLNDATVGSQFTPAIAANEKTVHVVWMDYYSGYVLGDVSVDDGSTWGKDMRVSNQSDSTDSPDVTFNGQATAWATWRVMSTTYQLHAAYYTPNGWVPADGAVINSSDFLQNPGIGAGNTQVYVVWEHSFFGDMSSETNVYLSRWEGRAWSDPIQINDEGDARQISPAMAIGSTGRLYAAWWDYRLHPYQPALYADRSTDGGATWGTDVRVDDNHPGQGAPAMGATGALTVHVAWASLQYEMGGTIYYDRSGDGGQTWGVDQSLIPSGSYVTANSPDLVVSGTLGIFVVWQQYDGLYLAVSRDGGTTWLSPTQIITSTGMLAKPTIAKDAGGILHLAWVETFWENNVRYIGYAR